LADAHEIPSSVTVQVFVKPEAQRVRLVIRVPIEAIREVDFPLRGPGYLDLSRIEPALHDAAKLWIADYVQLFENDAELPEPGMSATRVSIPSNRSYESYERAIANLAAAPLPDTTDLAWQQA